jgi:hypothetical protein
MSTFNYFVGNGASSFQDSSGSGLAWFGSGGFGSSLSVGSYNDKTYVSDGAGVVQGAEAYNVKWTHPGSGLIGQTGSGLPLTAIPNYQATVNVRWTHTSAVRTTNVKFKCYDRYNVNNPPSGVTVYGADIVHPTVTQTNNGSGSATWVALTGSGSYLSLTASPGTSGFRPLGTSTSDSQHDWYVAVSVAPTVIGSLSQIGFAVELEYL